ncbi:unnamed protein product, partial [Cylicostephanus goldi]
MISVLVCLLPVLAYGEQKSADMGKDTFKLESQQKFSRNLDRAQQELIRGCEDIQGIELALCIVDRYALDLQTKQNERLIQLKSRGASKKGENDFPRKREELKGVKHKTGEDAFESQKQHLKKPQFGVNFSNAYRTRR